MYHFPTATPGRAFCFALVLLILGACGQQDTVQQTREDPAEPIQTAATQEPGDPDDQSGDNLLAEDLEAKVAANLALADLADGQGDMVVSKCASCALHMDGSEEHALAHAGYQMHFCSAFCKENFAEDTKVKIAAMTIETGAEDDLPE